MVTEFRSARYRVAQVAESGMSMSAAPFHVPSANTRLAYVPWPADSREDGSKWRSCLKAVILCHGLT